MKKFLLPFVALATTVSAMAVTAPTAEELARFSTMISYEGEQVSFGNVGKVQVTYANEGSTSMLNVLDVKNQTNMKVGVDWESGQLTVSPQMMGGDYETGDYYLLVPASATDKTPMEAYSDRVYGTIDLEKGVMELEAWNCIVTSSSFADNKGKKYENDLTSKIVCTNAHVELGAIELNDDWIYQRTMTKSNVDAYAELNGNTLTVYNFDDLGSCIPFTLNDAKTAWTIDSEALVNQSSNKKRNYVVKSILPSVVGSEEFEFFTVPTLDGTITNGTTLTANKYFTVVDKNASYNDMGVYYSMVINLDFDLTATAIKAIDGNKTVKSVTYYNINGVESATPHNGVNIAVTTYTDGTRQASKIVK